MGDDFENAMYEIEVNSSGFARAFKKLAEVRYTDVPILIDILFLIFMFAIYFRFKHSLVISTLQFFFLCSLIYESPFINAYLQENWKDFGFSTNYFDSEGLIVFLLFSLPLSIICILQILALFFDLCKSFHS